MYKDLVWQPALAVITGSETTEDVLNKLAKFKAAESRIDNLNEGNRQREAVETELMDAVTELKVCWCIFGPLPSLEDLVNPPGELEIGEDLNQYKNDPDIVEAVCKGVIEEGGINDKIEECSPPQMSWVGMVRLSESLWKVFLGANVEAGYEFSKVWGSLRSKSKLYVMSLQGCYYWILIVEGVCYALAERSPWLEVSWCGIGSGLSALATCDADMW